MSDESPSTSSSSEPATGRIAENQAGGFKEMPPNRPAEREKKELTAREAGKQLADARTVDQWGKPKPEATDPVFYSDGKGGRAPDNEAITLERAADDLKAWRDVQEGAAELDAAVEFEKATDKLRRDEGLDPVTAELPEPNTPQLEQAEPAIPGLDPAVQAAIKLPQVREYLDAETAKVAQVESEYTAATKASHNAGLATFAVSFPEFQNHTPEQIIAKMRNMEHTNPQRYAHALNSLNAMAATERALIQNEQRMRHAQRQNFEREAKQHDAAFDRLIGPQTPQQKAAFGKEAIAFAGEFGITQPQFLHLMQTNPVMRHVGFQKMIHEAVTARLARKAVAAQRGKAAPVPTVARPGNGGARGIERNVANLDALNKRLASSGSIKDAAALLVARRKGR